MQKSSFPPLWERKPTATQRWNLLRSHWDRPFAGLHYARLTAPGPTGSRAEHVTDMLSVPRRIHANKLHAALSAVFCRISAGTLPPAVRWLTRTRLCWQRKKNGKPRPIKMGELLRSAYAKRLVNQHQVTLRSKVLRMHLWGFSLPGACEGLCHWRGTIGPLAADGTLEPLGRGRPVPGQHVWQRRVTLHSRSPPRTLPGSLD